MQPWQVAMVVLVAVLVGAALPVLVQLSLTLKMARGLLSTSGQRLDGALAEATTAATEIGALAESLHAVADKVRVAAAIGAAVGPAVAAAVHALRAPASAASNGKEDDHDRTG